MHQREATAEYARRVASALYRGSLVHTRRDHVRRTFRYPVFMAAIEVDELEDIDRHLRLFSYNRRNLFSLYDADYSTPIAPRSHGVASATRTSRAHVTSTTLVTNLRLMGYAFNPVSFFLRYAGDELVSVMAEVNNTYGGRHGYVLDDSNRIASDAVARTASDAAPRATAEDPRTASDAGARTTARVGFRTTRELFVSPFLHGPRTYEWWFPARRDPARLAITMHVDAPEGERVFSATVSGERRALTDRSLLGAAARYPFNTAQVIGLIHLEAMKLRFLHGEPYRRPGPDHRPLEA